MHAECVGKGAGGRRHGFQRVRLILARVTLPAHHAARSHDAGLPRLHVLVAAAGSAHHGSRRDWILEQPLGAGVVHHRKLAACGIRTSAAKVAHAVRIHAEEVRRVGCARDPHIAHIGRVHGGQSGNSCPSLTGTHHRGRGRPGPAGVHVVITCTVNQRKIWRGRHRPTHHLGKAYAGKQGKQ